LNIDQPYCACVSISRSKGYIKGILAHMFNYYMYPP
jgi:hypothetical protein